jgi:hypothetical protein
MSQWKKINFAEDIEIDDAGEISIYAGYNDYGNIYVTAQAEELAKWLRDNYK